MTMRCLSGRHARFRCCLLLAAAFCACSFGATPAAAHHAYSMYDGARELTVQGVVAKFEWMNPHVFIWVYVRKPAGQSGYDLYAFENGSTNVLSRRGWSKSTFTEGEEISLVYWPLKSGQQGGHMKEATHANGTVTRGVGGPRGVNGDRAAEQEGD